MMIHRPASLRDEVTPVLNPTVQKAEVDSKSNAANPNELSVMHSKRVAVKMVPSEKANTRKALWSSAKGSVERNSSNFVCPRNEETTARSSSESGGLDSASRGTRTGPNEHQQ